MRGLNEWLERDVQDRQAELRGVTARIDELRNDLATRSEERDPNRRDERSPTHRAPTRLEEKDPSRGDHHSPTHRTSRTPSRFSEADPRSHGHHTPRRGRSSDEGDPGHRHPSYDEGVHPPPHRAPTQHSEEDAPSHSHRTLSHGIPASPRFEDPPRSPTVIKIERPEQIHPESLTGRSMIIAPGERAFSPGYVDYCGYGLILTNLPGRRPMSPAITQHDDGRPRHRLPPAEDDEADPCGRRSASRFLDDEAGLHAVRASFRSLLMSSSLDSVKVLAASSASLYMEIQKVSFSMTNMSIPQGIWHAMCIHSSLPL
ncbi:hypothetical protein F4604DRAFT_1933097 [Suillus subluteus]|nr:hypothetical protein F4604DRAFT_1933097 [Suillus subluteus]